MDQKQDVFSGLWDSHCTDLNNSQEIGKDNLERTLSSEDLQLLSKPNVQKNKKQKQKDHDSTRQEVLQQEYLHLAELEKKVAQIAKSKEGMFLLAQNSIIIMMIIPKIKNNLISHNCKESYFIFGEFYQNLIQMAPFLLIGRQYTSVEVFRKLTNLPILPSLPNFWPNLPTYPKLPILPYLVKIKNPLNVLKFKLHNFIFQFEIL